MRKIAFVGDNRNRRNWGCRSTSISLHQILSTKLTISSVISGKYTGFNSDTQVGLSKLVSVPSYNALLRQQGRNRLQRTLLKVEKSLGATDDYISEDPEQSSQNILEHKDSHPILTHIYNSIHDAEEVVINGEGTIIFTTPMRRDLLFFLAIIELAKHLGKKVHLVNTIISDCPVSGRNEQVFSSTMASLTKCDTILLRDPTSYELLIEFNPKIHCRHVPDALFGWQKYTREIHFRPPNTGDMIVPFPEDESLFGQLDFSQPYICIGGSSLRTTDSYNKANAEEDVVSAFERLVDRMRSLDTQLYLVQTCSGDEFLKKVSSRTGVPLIPLGIPIVSAVAILARARLFVSGRYHPSIMASLGGTPCILMESNSHKTMSLQRVLEYETSRLFPFIPTDDECKEILSHANHLLQEGDSLREKISHVVSRRHAEAIELPEHL